MSKKNKIIFYKDFQYCFFTRNGGVSKKNYSSLNCAFNKGDKNTLKGLVSKDVFIAFEKAINEGSNNPSSQFYSLVIDGIEDAKVENGKIIISKLDFIMFYNI